MNSARLIMGVLAVMAGAGLLKFGNENYEVLKADLGLLAPVLCLVGRIVLLIYGVKSFRKSFA